MTCPVCGRPLGLIEEVLAASDTGVQCHGCWKLLRRLKPARRLAAVTALRTPARPQKKTLRRAA